MNDPHFLTPTTVPAQRPEPPAPASWFDGALKRRLVAMTTLLVLTAAFSLAGVELSKGLFLLVGVHVATLVLAREIIPRFDTIAKQHRVLVVFMSSEMLVMCGITHFIAGTRWMGVGLLVTTVMLPNFALPARFARWTTLAGVTSWVSLLLLETAGAIPSYPLAGLPSIAGNWTLFTAAAVSGSALLIFGFFALQSFGQVMRANEAQLRASESRYRATLAALREVVFQVDERGRWALLSPAWHTLTGQLVPASLGQPMFPSFHIDDQASLRTALGMLREGHRCPPLEVRLRGVDGEWRIVEARLQLPDLSDGAPDDFVRPRSAMLYAGTLTDVTEQRKLEEQVRQTQRLEAVGRLAGGVAHDFNNVLTSIQMSVEMIEAETAPDAEIAPDLRAIQAAALRGASLTRQLLSFSRRQQVSPAIADAGALTVGLDPVLRRLLPRPEALVLRAEPGAYTLVDTFQFEQIVAQLVMNARDATRADRRIEVELVTADISAGEPPALVGEPKVPAAGLVGDDVPPGRWVILRVRDSGDGISAAALPHVFEPFFTTKGRGEGSGLGLATAYGAVRQAKGYMRIATAVGFGTTVEVYLPRQAPPHDRTPSTAIPSHSDFAATPAMSTRAMQPLTVLVAEDEVSVRSGVRRILEKRGWTVIEAADGRQALAALGASGGSVDLLLTDVVMPDLGGRELVRIVDAEWPSTLVLFMSGYTADDAGHAATVLDGRPLVQKPFTADALLGAIDRVIASRHTEGTIDRR